MDYGRSSKTALTWIADRLSSKGSSTKNEREMFKKISSSISELFPDAGSTITVTVDRDFAKEFGILGSDGKPLNEPLNEPLKLTFKKPILTNLSISNEGTKKRVVKEQRAFNSENAVKELAGILKNKIDNQNSGALDNIKNVITNYLDGLAKNDLEESNGRYLAAQKEINSIIDSSGLADKDQLEHLKHGLSWLHTQKTGKMADNEVPSGLKMGLTYEQERDFIHLRGLLEFIDCRHSVQCKSGMDRTLTMSAIASTKEVLSHYQKSGDENLKANLLKSLFFGLGHNPCFRNRGPKKGTESEAVIKSLNHDFTLRLFPKDEKKSSPIKRL